MKNYIHSSFNEISEYYHGVSKIEIHLRIFEKSLALKKIEHSILRWSVRTFEHWILNENFDVNESFRPLYKEYYMLDAQFLSLMLLGPVALIFKKRVTWEPAELG